MMTEKTKHFLAYLYSIIFISHLLKSENGLISINKTKNSPTLSISQHARYCINSADLKKKVPIMQHAT